MILLKIFLLCLPSVLAFGFGSSNKCQKVKIDSNKCAVLFDDDGCKGWALPVGTGYTKLSFTKRNDAESIVVKKGCTLQGYDHENKKGKSVTIDAAYSNYDLAKELEGKKDLEERISSVVCQCRTSNSNNIGSSGSFGSNNIGSSGSFGSNNIGSSGSFGSNRPGGSGSFGGYGNSNNRPNYGNNNPGSFGSSYGRSRNSNYETLNRGGYRNRNNYNSRRTGNAGPNCDRVTFPRGVGCIVYDKGDCTVQSWSSPLKLNSGQSKSFSLFDSMSNFKYKNTIESVSVKAGCSLEVFRDSNFRDTRTVFKATRNADLHETLDNGSKYEKINNDIESLRCSC